jgi:vancomycin permeability regulator SanA
VPEQDILSDRYGLSTYDSLTRAAALYEIRRVVIVTQTYHLYRALYIAHKKGMEAIGVDADIRTYRLQWYRDLREVLARCKDFYATQRDVPPAYMAPGGEN